MGQLGTGPATLGATLATSMLKPAQPRFIYITGCDGTGKTTQARLLVEGLRSTGAQVRHVWLRFPFFVSLPLLAYARWRGYSWYESSAGARHGYWDFRRSQLLRRLLPWTLLIDAAITGLQRIFLPLSRGTTIVCERYVLDMLVDMSVAFGDASPFESKSGRLFARLIPPDAVVVVLDLEPPLIMARRPDLRSDRDLHMRVAMFKCMANAFSVPVLSSVAPVADVHRELLQRIATVPASKHEYYAISQSLLLRPLLASPAGALGVHWVLQGMGYMDRTERLYKLGLDLLLAAVLLGLLSSIGLSWVLATVIAVGLAHTVNLAVNGQTWVVLKHFRLVQHSRQEFEDYLASLMMRLQSEPSLVYAAVYGSRVRDQWNPASDLDVRLVRRRGWINAMRACTAALRERTRATLQRFPLDIYVLDNQVGLCNLRVDEPPLILLDRLGTFD